MCTFFTPDWEFGLVLVSLPTGSITKEFPFKMNYSRISIKLCDSITPVNVVFCSPKICSFVTRKNYLINKTSSYNKKIVTSFLDFYKIGIYRKLRTRPFTMI